MVQLIYELDFGGTEKTLATLVRGLDKGKYNITVCCIAPLGPVAEEIKKVHDMSIISLNAPGRYSLFAFFKLWRLLKKHKTHLLQSYLYYDNFISRIIGKIAGVPIIINGQRHLSYLDSPLRHFLDRLLSSRRDLIIANSNATKRSLVLTENIPENQIKVIYSGKDPAIFDKQVNITEIRKKFGFKNKELIVGILAKLREEKNHKLFLETAVEISKEMNNVKFFIVGGGPFHKYVFELVNKLNIQDKIIFAGDQKDIVSMLAIFDVSVLTSISDSFPGAVLESMAMSKPVVATPVGGVPEMIVHGETGFLGETKEELAKAIIVLLKNPKLRKQMGMAGRERFEKYFTVDKMVKEYEKVYDSYIEKKLKCQNQKSFT